MGRRAGMPLPFIVGGEKDDVPRALLAGLAETGGNVRITAHRMGVTREWIHQLLTRFGLRGELRRLRAQAKRGMDPTWTST